MSFVYKGTVEKEGKIINGKPNKGGPLFIQVNPDFPFDLETPNNNLEVFYTKEKDPTEQSEFRTKIYFLNDLTKVTAIKIFNIDDSKPGEVLIRQNTKKVK